MRALTTIWLCVGLLFSGEARSQPSASDPDDPPRSKLPRVSYLEVARQEIIHGHLDKAVKALAAARRCWRKHRTACGFDRLDYQSLVGIVYLEHGKYRKAAKAFLEVVDKKPQRTSAWLYLGQALYALQKYRAAVIALRKAHVVGKDMPRYFAMLARSAHKSHQHEVARQSLAEGLERFPRDRVLLIDLTLLYTRHGLLKSAMTIAQYFLRATGGEILAHLMVADAYIEARRYGRAIGVLEEARLAAPRDHRVLERLAYTYARKGLPYASARLFARLARQAPSFAHATAEQYRTVGRHREALRWNRRVPDPKKRLRQRLDIYLETGAYRRALLLQGPLRRAGALDAAVSYRLAHAAIRVGRYQVAARLLASLSSGPWVRLGERLHQVLLVCKEKPWLCP